MTLVIPPLKFEMFTCMSDFTLSVIITTRNRRAVLLRCINSLGESTYKDFELIVIDDASSDGTEALKEGDLPVKNATIIHSKEQLMMVKARNLGASHAKGRYLLMVDDDNVVPSDTLEKLVDAMDANPDYGILGPVIYNLSSGSLVMCGQRINLFTGRTTGLKSFTGSEIIDSHGVPNAFIIRKSMFDEIGGFDPKIIQTFTEPDFAYQARLRSAKCGFLASAKIYHDIPADGDFTPRSLGGKYVQKAYCLMRNRTVMVARYGSLLQKCVYFLVFSWFWPLVYSLIMVRWRKMELIPFYWQGFIDGLRYMFTGKLVSSLPRLLNKKFGEG